MLRKVALVGLCAFVAVVALALADDRAETKIAKTRVVRTADGGHYSGRIKSPEDRCLLRRHVKVIHLSVPPFEIGTDTTNRDGLWELSGPLPPSDSERVKVIVGGTPHCDSAKKIYVLSEILR